MRMRSWNQFNGRSTQRTKYKGLYNNNQGRKSIKPIVKWIVKSKTDSEIQVKIHNTILLYFKEG